MKFPNFFLVGAPKCGTTTLANMLSQNPQIFFSGQKEPHFFSTDFNTEEQLSLRQYQKLFSKADNSHVAVGEGSVYYMYSQIAVPSIEETYAGSKYIAMLRHPVDMAISIHGQQKFSGRETIEDFETAWKQSSVLREYLKVCRLGHQVERLVKNVGRDRVLLLSLDQLRDNPRNTYLKACQFLNVDDDGRTSFVRKNGARTANSVRYNRMIKYLSRTRVKLGLPWLGGVGDRLIGLNAKKAERPKISLQIVSEMEDFFAEDVAIIKEHFGIQLELGAKSYCY